MRKKIIATIVVFVLILAGFGSVIIAGSYTVIKTSGMNNDKGSNAGTRYLGGQIDQSQQQCSGNGALFGGGYTLNRGQSFVPTLPFLSGVKVLISKLGNPGGDITVSIRATCNGNDLTSIVIPESNVPNTHWYKWNWLEADFPDISVTPGKKYYIRSTVPSHVDSYNCYVWYSWNGEPPDGDLYPNGEALTGCGTILWGMDFCFITYGYTSNPPPYTPSNPNPSNGENNVDVNRDLYWSGGDPDGDTVYYDVYFEAGDSTPDVRVSNDQTSTYYDPGIMSKDTTYYWRIEAVDEHGEPANPQGSTWHFTTKEPTNNPPNKPNQPVGPTYVLTDVQYNYRVSTTDPEGDDVQYGWLWAGGGAGEWTDFYPSGETVTISHSWSNARPTPYPVRVLARDSKNNLGGLSDALNVDVIDEKEVWCLLVAVSNSSDDSQDSDCFNNAIWELYYALHDSTDGLGIPDNHIRVYASGYETVGINGQPPPLIHGEPTRRNLLERAGEGFNWLEDKSSNSDYILFCYQNHGTINNFLLSDGNNDQLMTATELDQALDRIDYHRAILFLGQCHSGSFIDECGADDRVIITAAPANEHATGVEADVNGDGFEQNGGAQLEPEDGISNDPTARYFAYAIKGYADNKVTCDFDDGTSHSFGNNDSFCSMDEVFTFITFSENHDEWPTDNPIFDNPVLSDPGNIADIVSLGPYPGTHFSMFHRGNISIETSGTVFPTLDVDFNVTVWNTGNLDLTDATLRICFGTCVGSVFTTLENQTFLISLCPGENTTIPVFLQAPYGGLFYIAMDLHLDGTSLDNMFFKLTTVGPSDDNLPQCRNQDQNRTCISQGESILLYAQGKDDVALDWAWLATNEAGIWQNFTGGTGDWWDTEWEYRKQIIINHNMVEDDLINFPVLILYTSSDFANHAQNDGDDFIFVDSTHSFKYNHEIEYYNGETGELVAWVNVTSLSSSQDTVCYLYYGNSYCSNQENVHNTWDSSYKLVYHFSETSGLPQDSTSNNNDATIASCEMNSDGIIDGDAYFDKSEGGYVRCGLTQLKISTVTLALKKNGDTNCGGWIISTHQCNDNFHNFALGTSMSATPGHAIFAQLEGWGEKELEGGDSTEWYDNEIHTATFTSNDVTDHYEIFQDGTLVDSDTNNGWDLTDPEPYKIAKLQDECTPHYWGDGNIDELRISNIVRSHAWINTAYNTLNLPSTFFSVGIEEEYEPLSNYGSPIKMVENKEWQWSHFIWQNSSIPVGTTIGWRIYYSDASGNWNCTDIVSFNIIGEWSPWNYDGNHDFVIQKSEVIKSIQDYFNYLIEKWQVIDVIQLYFST